MQTAAVVIGSGAAAFAWRQVRLTRHAGNGANALNIWTILQSERARSARKQLYEAVESKGPFVAPVDGNEPMAWGAPAVEAARHVAQLCSVVGAVVKRDYVPRDLIVEEWGAMIVRLWSLAKPVIDMDRQRLGDPTHDSNFEWLAIQCGYLGV